MTSNIQPFYYHTTEIYQKEKDAIFKKTWQFVGFRSQLKNHNDFISRTIGDTPIVIQNINNVVKAFLNVCSHRFSILQQEEFGNRPLVCPYHGWSYNQDGIPTGIPKKPLFEEFTQTQLEQMRLKSFDLEFCGNLCFVCLDKPAVRLKNYLGDFFDELNNISLALGEMIDINQMDIIANWKIIVENTLESYHVGMVHANTFKKLGASGIKFNFTSLHSNWDAPVSKQSDALQKIESMFLPRQYDIKGYKHFFIFPNLLISTTRGVSYNFSLINPLNEKSSRFTSYVFTAVANSNAKKALLSAYHDILINFNREVFKEDKAICEQVQKGVYHTELTGVLSIEEERVHAFQNCYINLLQPHDSN